MSDYLPSFIVEPVLRQARRFSRLSGREESPGPTPGPLPLPAPSPAPTSNFLTTVPDLQRFNPTRFWNTSPPPSAGEDEPSESTLQSIARNVQLWASQINNLDVIPSPPLEPVPLDTRDDALTESGGRDDSEATQFPTLDTASAEPPRPTRLQEHRTQSDTSLNPAHELSYRSQAFAEHGRGNSLSEPVDGVREVLPTEDGVVNGTPAMEDNHYRRRDGTGALPEDDGMGPVRRKINAIRAGSGTNAEKSQLIHALMTEGHRHSQALVAAKNSSLTRTRPASPLSMNSVKNQDVIFNLSAADTAPSYAPLDAEGSQSDLPDPAKADLGCVHYTRNVKLQCATCERWYVCRLCHDEVEDHTLPRRETRYMLCMLCTTPQPASQDCRGCGVQAACYYCSICKLWNNDSEKAIYHCDDCGICRLGKGLGKDFFHCKKCAACMSIQAESTHRCIEKSTKCDCPICGEYMFTSNKPVAFMRCGHSIHEECFKDWCNTSYKCPICSKSIANMESQFRRLDRHIEEQPMPEEYRENRAFVFCNDCNSRSVTKYHWLGLKCAICESYNTTQLELLGPEQPSQLIRQHSERALELGVGEAGMTASQSHTPSGALTTPASATVSPSAERPVLDTAAARSPPGQGSPFLLPHSPTRSTRSITPVVSSYFGTGQRPEARRRESYFSIFSAGQPSSPRSNNAGADDAEDLDFWGGHSPRSHEDDTMDVADGSTSDSSSEDEVMEDEDDADEDEDAMDIIGHR